MQRKLLIVDGNVLIYSAIMKGLEKPKAVEYFLSNLNTICSFEYKPNTVAVVFDGGLSQRRMELFPEYKKNRSGKSDEQKRQRADVLRQAKDTQSAVFGILMNLGLRTLQFPGIEADDMVYSFVSLYRDANPSCDVVIYSADSDFYQLVHPGVSLLHPAKGKINIDNFESVALLPHPKLILLMKSLAGDKSDGIRGVKGVGETTAREVIVDFYKRSPQDRDYFSRWSMESYEDLAVDFYHFVEQNHRQFSKRVHNLLEPEGKEDFFRFMKVNTINAIDLQILGMVPKVKAILMNRPQANFDYVFKNLSELGCNTVASRFTLFTGTFEGMS